MANKIKLPLVTGFRVTGFQPIYSANIELTMESGPYVILGGNGLGKTTLMQAVVYGLAGGLDETIEDVKASRWSHNYFRGRLSSNQVAAAQVEVDFRLGKHNVSVRRGFRGSQVTGVRDGRGAWIEAGNDTDPGELFADLLREHGGYLAASDFAFVVHRLLYLPETRRLIAWDTDAQIRLLMLLNQDIALEREFREQRAQLKFIDSKKRHLHVAVGKAQEQIESLMEYEDCDEEAEEIVEEPEEESPKADEEQLPNLVSQLNELVRKRTEAERKARGLAADLSRVSACIDELREQIETAEAGLVANFLSETEREQNLALAKLVDGDICPACGQKHAGLAAIARKHLRESRCVLCGLDEVHAINPELGTLRDQLEQRMREQQAFEEVVRLARSEAENIHDQELAMQARVNAVRYSRSVVAMVERNLPSMTVDNLRDLKKRLEDEEADAERQINEIRDKLSSEYESFREKMDLRMDGLRAAYAGFATDFLGLPCELEEVAQGGLMELKMFVPKFDDVVRPIAESCSEAQRFFLDIAFRMALIDAAGGERGTATFLCETPETALDVSYVDNVVAMFLSFSQRQHNTLLTANVQPSGIAEKLMAKVPKRDRKARMVNLLELGRLSGVQTRARPLFKSITDRMLNTAVPRGKK